MLQMQCPAHGTATQTVPGAPHLQRAVVLPCSRAKQSIQVRDERSNQRACAPCQTHVNLVELVRLN